jgi:RND family efflux transporter MFP subunit
MTRSSLPLRLGAPLAFLLVACSDPAREERQPDRTVAAPIAVARARPLAETYEAVGTVRSRTEIPVSSQILARVVAIAVREGDPVERGAILIQLDDRTLAAELGRAEAALRVARATYRRYRALLERRSVSRQEFDEVEARYRAARAEADRARSALADSKIVSPIDGVVTSKRTEVGALAVPGMPLLVVEDDRSYRLEVSVEESRLAYAPLGRTVPVVVDALDPTAALEGRVAEIVPAADPSSRSFRVKLDLPPSKGLRSGMFGRARFAGGERLAVTVPSDALVERGQLVGIYVVEADGRARLRLVKTGRREGNEVEILAGLDGGERFVTSPGPSVEDGARILPAQEGAPSDQGRD